MYLHTGARTGRHALRRDVCLASCGLVLGIFSPGSVLLGVTASKHYKNDEVSEKRGGKRKLEKYC